MHKPIQFKDLSLNYPHKTCFENFSGQIHFGDRIAIIGCNGSGKSTLLNILQGNRIAGYGEVKFPNDACVGYLPQVIDDFPELSGGQRLNHLLTEQLAVDPNVLLLDEPTNHLDKKNRRSLIRMLQKYQGTLVLVSHDVELINETTDILWHIDSPKVTVFSGCYHDYQQELIQKKEMLEREIVTLSRKKKEAHLGLMREQERNKRTKIRGEKQIEQRKWPTIRSCTKLGSAVKTGDRRLSQLNTKKQQVLEQRAAIYQSEVILPKFKLKAPEHHKVLVTIRDASIAYANTIPVLHDINLHLQACERVALCGENGSGKSTLLKAILGEPLLNKTGDWLVPDKVDIGYLDQHYAHLTMDKTVMDMIGEAMPKAPSYEIRKHLNDFLFRKNEEVEARISNLSGGEKARLSLALIAASPPQLLVLDELTNNLDMETRTHVTEVLREFPGAMIVISHDEDFLQAIHIDTIYQINQGTIELLNESQNGVVENE